MAQGVIDQNEGGHRFDHGHSSREDAGVMSSPSGKRGVFHIHVHGLLLPHDGGHRFESNAKVNGLPVGNSALDSPRAIGRGDHFSAFGAERVVVLRASEMDPMETRADIKAFGGGQA